MKTISAVPLIFICAILIGCQEDSTYAMGNIERDQHLLSSPVTEPIVFINVTEGQKVSKGDTLLQLDTRRADALLAQRKAELDQAEAVLSGLASGTRPEQLSAAFAALNATQAAKIEAELKYQRFSKLYQSRVIGKADYDAAKAGRDTTKANAQQAHDQWLELKNGAREEDIVQARAKVDAAQAALLGQQIGLDDLTIKAPIDGVIETLPWHIGDRITAGTPLISFIADSLPYARVYLPANALSSLKIGD